MANWCENTVKFSGDENRLKQLISLFTRLGRKGKKETLGQLPKFISKEKPHFVDISVKSETIYYSTKWNPNNEVLKEIADHFQLDFNNRYDELQMGIFGEASYQNGILLDVKLDPVDFQAYHYDKELLAYLYEGNSYEFEWPIFEKLLEKRKEEIKQSLNLTASGQLPEELVFKSTSKISLNELIGLYEELTPGDIVLKFAEHKNFDGARKAFQSWDEEAITRMANHLNLSFRHEEELYSTKDKYIAMSFLKQLISEWESNGHKKIERLLEDPLQGQAAELLKIRLSGKLPHIDLAGTDFTIDWRLRQLRETEQPWKHISFENLDIDEFSEGYLCFFDTQSHEIFIPEENITELPENVVVLEIPNELKLDPVALARDLGIDEAELLAEHPIQMNLAAKVFPLSESGLPDFIENNRKRLGSSQHIEERQHKRGR
jgi:hypothetical protein